MMYPALVLLLNFSEEIRWNLFYNGHTLAGFQSVEYEEY